MKSNATFKVFLCERHEYNKEFTHTGTDAEGNDTFDVELTYTGKTTKMLGKSANELLTLNSIPEWKAEIIGEFTAEAGHTANGQHKYDFSRNPITLTN